MSSVRLISLLELFSSPRFVFARPGNHTLTAQLVETFNNLIQYQYESNGVLVYTILQRKAVFEQLAGLSLAEWQAAEAARARAKAVKERAERRKHKGAASPSSTAERMKQRAVVKASSSAKKASSAGGGSSGSGEGETSPRAGAGAGAGAGASPGAGADDGSSKVTGNINDSEWVVRNSEAQLMPAGGAAHEATAAPGRASTAKAQAGAEAPTSPASPARAAAAAATATATATSASASAASGSAAAAAEAPAAPAPAAAGATSPAAAPAAATPAAGAPAAAGTEAPAGAAAAPAPAAAASSPPQPQPQPQPQPWVATEEWWATAKRSLPMVALQRLIAYVQPLVEGHVEAHEGAVDADAVAEFIRSTTVVGILPVPHPIVMRRYEPNAYTALWFTTYLWCTVFLHTTAALPMWDANEILLFKIAVPGEERERDRAQSE